MPWCSNVIALTNIQIQWVKLLCWLARCYNRDIFEARIPVQKLFYSSAARLLSRIQLYPLFHYNHPVTSWSIVWKCRYNWWQNYGHSFLQNESFIIFFNPHLTIWMSKPIAALVSTLLTQWVTCSFEEVRLQGLPACFMSALYHTDLFV